MRKYNIFNRFEERFDKFPIRTNSRYRTIDPRSPVKIPCIDIKLARLKDAAECYADHFWGAYSVKDGRVSLPTYNALDRNSYQCRVMDTPLVYKPWRGVLITPFIQATVIYKRLKHIT